MRSRRWIWVLLCLLLAAGAWFLRPHGQPPAINTRTKPSALLKAAAPTVAQTTPFTILSTNNVQAAAAAMARANQFRYRLANTPRTLGELTGDPHAILLANALIDTGAKLTLPIPENLRAAGEPGAYIVQARGPIDNAFRAALAGAGAQIVSYIPNNAYLVTLSSGGASALTANPLTQAVIPYEPYYKLSPPLLAAVANNQPVDGLKVAAFPGTADATKTALQKIGVTVVAEETTPLGPFLTLKDVGDVAVVAQIPTLHIVEPLYRRVPANDLSRATVGVAVDTQAPTNYLGLSGSNVLVEVNDSGIDATHPDFGTGGGAPVRVLGDTLQSLVDTNGHGTHVAGIIAGDGTESITVSNVQGSIMGTNGVAVAGQFRGMAPAATLYSVTALGNRAEKITSDRYLQEAPARTNALISNNSWYYGGNNAYDLAAASYDAAVRDALPQVTGSQPVLFVFAAGNDGNGDDATDPGSGTPDSIDSPATAKNVITVGALQEFRSITNAVTNADGTISTPWQPETSTSYRVAGFSSRGNVGINTEGTYGRFKPDVVAPGTFIVSTRSSQWDIGTYFFASPTNFNVQDLSVVIQASSLGAGEFPLVPTNAVGVTIQLAPNSRSPVPFPTNFPIFFGLVSSAAYDYVTTNNQVSIPPDGNLTIADILNSEAFYGFNFAVSNFTSVPLDLDIILDTITTNNPGNYYLVLSNLNQSFGGVNPGSTGPGPYYRYETGTSMSAADVSGVLALMQDYFTNTLRTVPSPALLKAMLINGARPTGLYDLQVANNINFEGWGVINLPGSVPFGLTNRLDAPCSACFVDQSPTNALATGDSHTFTVKITDTNGVAQTLPLRVTLAWTDPPGDPAAAIKLVNNLGLVVSNLDNPANPVIFYGNDIGSGSIFNTPRGTNTTPVFDTVNNVANVFISPPLGTNYSVTVIGRGVNVNAVSAQTNNAAGVYAPNVVQDFALVVACGEGEVTNALTLTDAGITNNPTGAQNITFLGGTNAPLLNQLAGASTPLLGTNTVRTGTITVLDTNGVPVGSGPGFAPNAILTVGMTNQWHFYVITNPPGGAADVTNAAFITFLPDTLSIPRMGVFADDVANATTPEADIDMYVTTDTNLLTLSPVTISNCLHGAQVGLSAAGSVFNGASLGRSGTEFVVDIGSKPGQVYYVGVHAERQMAAEYDFLPIFSSTPFSQMQNGNQVVNGQLLPVNVPDGTPAHPGIAYVFGLAIYPMTVNQVVVTNSIVHQNIGDLIGTLNHNGVRDVLNNHDSFGNPPGPYNFQYDDSGAGNYPGSRVSDGPGSLRNFTGKEGIGVWRLTEVDNSLTQTGRVAGYGLTIVPHRDLRHGVTVTVQPGTWFYDYVDVPVGYTNLTVSATNLATVSVPPLQLYVKLGSEPTLADTNSEVLLTNCVTGTYPTGTLPGNSISLGPPLTPGRYWVGIFNPDSVAHDVYIVATLAFSASAIETVDFDSARPVPILDDAVTYDSIFVPRTDLIQDFNMGLRVDHARISDLVFHLISPDGTRYLLMENRGATSTNGCGVTVISTNTIPVSHNGGNEAVTNSFDTGFSSGTVTIAYDFYTLPDRMVVYDGATQLADTGLVPGAGTLNLTYSNSPIITVVMNPGGNTNYPTTLWQYTFKATQAKYYYLTFTENTNLTTTPIKFAPTPFVPSLSTNLVFADGFEGAAGDYTNGQTFGTNWTVISNQVSVVTDPTNAYEGNNFLALASGTVSNNLPTVAGKTYQLSFAYRGPGIVSLWRGENNGNDSVGTNNGTPTATVTYGPAEVGQGFQLNSSTQYVAVPASSTLSVGAGGGFTLDAWIYPTNVGVQDPIFEWNQGFVGGTIGTHFWIAHASGTLFANMVETSGASHQFWSAPNILTNNGFQHAALTYNRSSGRATIYRNGVSVAQSAIGNVILQTTFNFYIGKRPSDRPTDGTYGNFFGGIVDEGSLYQRALSASEIKAIYQKDGAGKFDTNAPFAGNLAEASVNLQGASPVTLSGSNTNWQVYTTTFAATGNGTPLVISGIEPGMLLDTFTLTPMPANLYYQPEQDISAINSTSAHGTWTLEIQDDRAGATNNATLLSWQLEFTFANTNLPSITPPIPILPPGVPITGTLGDPPGIPDVVTWYQVIVEANVIAATNRLLSANAPVSLLYSVNYPPTTNGPGDAVLIANSTGPAAAVLSAATSPALVPGGSYYLGVLGASNTTYTIEVDFYIPEATILTGGRPQTNTLAGGGIEYYAVTVPVNADFATNLLLFANGPLNLWFNQTNLPVGANPPDYPLLSGSTGGIGNPVLATNTTPPLVPGQTYFLAVQNTNSSPVTYGIAVNFHLLLLPGSFDYYLINVPTNADWATNILLFATGPVNLWFDPTNRPTGTNAGDSLFLAGATNGAYVLGTNSASPPYMVPGGTYWLGVQNTNSFPVTYAIRVDFHLVPPTNAPIYISSITATNIGGKFGFLLTWYAPTNDIFMVQWTANLLPANWHYFTNIITYTGPPTPTNGLFTFFDDGSQTSGFGPTRFYRLVLLTSPTNGVPQTNSVPPGGINYFLINVPTSADLATNRLLSATGPLNLWFDRTTPPTGTNAGDYLLLAGVTSGKSVLSTSSAPTNIIPGGSYWLGVQNTNSFAVTFGLEVDFHLLSIITLTNGVPYSSSNSASGNATDYYLYTVSTNAARVQFEVDNPGGDVTLLARFGLPLPGLTNFDYLSENPYTNGELIVVLTNSTPVTLRPGNWYLAVVNISGAPVTYTVMATEWPVTGRPFKVTGTQYTPPVGTNSGDFCITWTSLPGAYYYVQGVTDLASTNWVTVSPTLRATTNTTTYCVPLPSPFHFFRVVEGLAVKIYAPPVLSMLPNTNINEQTTLVVTNTATDPDSPPRTLGYTVTMLVDTNAIIANGWPTNYATTTPPPVITTNGIITWTPSEAQGPGVYIVTTVVTDNGSPPLSATNSFQVTVNETNRPPVFNGTPANQTNDELTLIVITNTATDPDLPPNPLTYTLTVSVDTNAMIANGWPTNYATTVPPPVISTNGIITWTPGKAEGPGVYVIATVVTDTNPWAINTTSFSVTNSFIVTVEEVNTAPGLPTQTNRTILAATPMTVTNTATDADIPPNPLTYQLSGPAGAAIDTNGIITWTPTLADVGTTNSFTTIVTDTNLYALVNRSLSATNFFTVTVVGTNTPPFWTGSISPQTNNELKPFVITNTATDTDSPPQTLSYTVTMRVDTNAMIANGWPTSYATTVPPPVINGSGVITWTPGEAQGPGVYLVTTVVTDNGLPPLSATNSFSLTVEEVNAAPVLPVQANRNVNALSTITIANTATDSDIPPNPLTYTLLAAPPGMAPGTNTGILTWMPTLAQMSNTYTVTTAVTDTNAYALVNQSLSATNSFTVTVIPPYTLGSGQPQTNSLPAGGTTWYLVNVPTNADFATNRLLFANPRPLNVGFSTNLPPGFTNAGDLLLLANSTGGQAVMDTNSSVPLLVPGSAYWLGVQNTNGVTVNYGIEVDFHLLPPLNTLFITHTNIGGTNGFLLTWYAPTNDLFQVQWTGGLNSPVAWNAFSNIVAYTTYITPGSSRFQFFDDGSHTGGLGPVRFYRLLLLGLATNTPPVFVGTPANQTIAALSTLVVTNNATDAQAPPQTLSYTLPGAPAGMTISTNGVITWTPTPAQAGTTNLITTFVTDNGVPNLGATNRFTVVVLPVTAPAAFTAPATFVTGTNAQLNGFASPNGRPSVAWFEWGTNQFFANRTASLSVGSGYQVVWVTNAIAGLLDSQAYYFRLVTSNAVSTACGAAQGFSDGNVVAWGDNSAGQTNVPVGLTNAVAIAGGEYHSLALKGDGTVLAWGDNSYGQTNMPAGLSNVVAVAGGVDHNLVLKSGGTVTAWGDNSYGQTNIPAGLSNVVAVAGGGYHNLALKGDGTVMAWGDNSYGQTNIPAGLSNVVAVAAGWYHNLALRNNGTVVAWGYGGDGETNVPAGLSNAVAIAGGEYHSLALKSDGTVAVWGDDTYQQTNLPAGLGGVAAIASGDYHSLALKSDGTVAAWGYGADGETNVPAGLGNVVAVAGGGYHSLALQAAAATFLVIPSIHTTLATNGIVLQWTAPANVSFQVQWATNLAPVIAWNTFPNVVISTNGAFSFTDTNAPVNMRFYRLMELP